MVTVAVSGKLPLDWATASQFPPDWVAGASWTDPPPEIEMVAVTGEPFDWKTCCKLTGLVETLCARRPAEIMNGQRPILNMSNFSRLH